MGCGPCFLLYFCFSLSLPDLLYHTIAADYRNRIVSPLRSSLLFSLPPAPLFFLSLPRSSLLFSPPLPLSLSLSLPFFFSPFFGGPVKETRWWSFALLDLYFWGFTACGVFSFFFLLTRGFFVSGAFIFSLDPPDVDVVEQIIACTYMKLQLIQYRLRRKSG